jgi:dephospho-CoA kinase
VKRRRVRHILKPVQPVILGLTGSIGMGKTAASNAFKRLGIPVLSSDDLVHRLLAKGGRAVAAVASAFPKTYKEGAIDRSAMAQEVFGKPDRLAKLESILHPMVLEESARYVARQRRQRRRLVVLDIPLLYETGGDSRTHAVAVVTAPAFVQRARVLVRRGQSPDRLAAILARQMPDAEKRRRADFVIPTGLTHRDSLRRLQRIAVLLKSRQIVNRNRD